MQKTIAGHHLVLKKIKWKKPIPSSPSSLTIRRRKTAVKKLTAASFEMKSVSLVGKGYLVDSVIQYEAAVMAGRARSHEFAASRTSRNV